MNYLVGRSCGEVWIKYLDHIVQNGNHQMDGSEKIIEGPCTMLEFLRFKNQDPIIERYAKLDVLQLYHQKLFSTDIIAPFKLSYGQRLFNHTGINQIEWLEKLLKNKPESKSAAVSLLSPNELPNAVPCLVNLMCRIRADKLLFTCVFRSQNAFKSYANYLALGDLQTKIANDLKVGIGPMLSMINSPHIYFADIDAVSQVLKDCENEIKI